ncbi:MAG: hypothetical protein PCFJNLEI_02826 [Verrucomicrobiae bacterium]|nr:hypothetical protein [Verrucomicrobiae bacterium]
MANGNHLELPASVARQLGAFRRGLWVAETLAAVFGAVAGIFGAYLVLFVSDRLWETPVWLRVLLTVGCLAFVAGWAWFWLTRWGIRQRDNRQLARMIQRHFPKLGDRLLGIVELAHPATRPNNISEALSEAAMRQVAGETEALDFATAVPKRQERRWGIVLACLGVLAVAALAVLPLAGVNVWHRLLNPFGGAARYTLAKLDGLPTRLIVAFGEPFTLTAKVQPSSEWIPAVARGRYEKQPVIEAPVAENSFTFQVPGQTAAGTFSVKAGDAQTAVQVEPLHRPELLELRAVVELPAYLGYPPVTQDVRRGTIELVAESRFTLNGRTSRELARVDQGGQVAGAQFSLPALAVKAPETIQFQWEDAHGLTAKAPFKLKLNVVDDQPPRADFRGLQRIVAMLEDEVLEFEAVAEDDYGVRALQLTWTGGGNTAASVAAAKGELAVTEGGQLMRELSGKIHFAPKTLRIGPQRIELRAVANDYRPGREPVESSPYYVIILDKTEHAKLVQREFDRLVEKLEELQRTEEALFERNEQLQREIEKSRNPAEHAEKLAEQEQAERRNTAELKKLESDLAKLTKEALRNDQIGADVVAQWAELVAQLAELTKSAMPKVSTALQQAAASKSSGEQQGNTREALQRQEEVLKQLAAALKQMNQAGEMMQAGNFVGRLRKMAAVEKTIGEKLTELFPQTIGATLDQIAPALRIKVQRIGDQQFQAQQGVQQIRDEMGSFVVRTQQEKYRRVHREMVEMKVVEDLERLTGLLDKKVSQEGIAGAQQWTKQLNEWADRLQPPPQDDGGGGAGGGGGNQKPDPAVVAAIMKLMRVRLGEEDLRSHTRALDTRRADPDYRKHAESLSDQQAQLRAETAEAGAVLQGLQGVPELLGKVDGAMKDATFILARPQTDLEVIAAETEVIELLSDLLDQAGKSSGGNTAGLAAMMQALKQQQGSQPGKNGGGSEAGGVSERENVPVTGDPAGNATERRNVNKGSGPDLNKVPAEFREALQYYYEKVEKW